MDHSLIELLPPVHRLALAYAPARARPAWLALLALDARLAQQLRGRREPLLTQMRLAWWRDRLGEDAARWPTGEPLLAALAAWQGQHGALIALVDGWEMLLGEAPLPIAALEALVAGRGAAMAALARVLGQADNAAAAHHAGAGWAIADLAARLSHPDERAAALTLGESHAWQGRQLSRALRPLVVLHGLSARSWRDRQSGSSNAHFWLALRLGLLGI